MPKKYYVDVPPEVQGLRWLQDNDPRKKWKESIAGREGEPRRDFYVDGPPSPEDKLNKQIDLIKLVERLEARLSPREWKILVRHGVLEHTLFDIAKEFGVTPVRILQIYNQALRHCREYLKLSGSFKEDYYPTRKKRHKPDVEDAEEEGEVGDESLLPVDPRSSGSQLTPEKLQRLVELLTGKEE